MSCGWFLSFLSVEDDLHLSDVILSYVVMILSSLAGTSNRLLNIYHGLACQKIELALLIQQYAKRILRWPVTWRELWGTGWRGGGRATWNRQASLSQSAPWNEILRPFVCTMLICMTNCFRSGRPPQVHHGDLVLWSFNPNQRHNAGWISIRFKWHQYCLKLISFYALLIMYFKYGPYHIV